MTKQEKQHMVKKFQELHNKGWTNAAIAEKYHVSEQIVMIYLKSES